MTTSDKAALLALADKLETLPKVQTGDPEHPRANEPKHIPPHGSSEHMSDESSARDILEYHLHNGEAGPTRFNMDQHLHHDVGGMPAFALATVGWPSHTTDHQNEEVWRHSDTLRSLAQERLGLDDDTAAALFDGPNHAGRQRRFIEPTQAAQACRLAADGASPEDLWPTVDREAIHSLSELENKWTYHDEHIREMAEQDRLEAIEASPGRSTDPDDDKGPDEADLAEVQGFDWSTETTVALDAKIHPTADIGRVTRIAKHCEIAAGAIIHDGVDLPTSVKVGERSELGHGTGIGKNTAIGNDCAFDACTVGANVTIGSNVNVELGAVIGDHAVIADNAKIRTRSSIPAYANVEAFAEIAATDKVEADERNHVADTAEVHESSKLGARTHVRGTSKIENGVQTIREVSITDSTVQANTLIGSQVDVERSKIGPLAVVGNNTTITDSEIRKGGIQPGVRINKSTIEAGYELSRNSSVSRSTIGPELSAHGSPTIEGSNIGRNCRILGGRRRTSIVDSTIGQDAKIGDSRIKRSTIGDRATIENPTIGTSPRATRITDSRIGSGTTVGKEAIAITKSGIGPGCKIEGSISSSSIGKNIRIKRGTVVRSSEIGDDVTIGEQCFIDRGTTLERGVVIQDGARISSKVTIGRDCVIGKGAVIAYGMTVPPNTQIPAGAAYPGRATTTDDRSGAGVAVRGAGRPAGDTRPQPPTPAEHTRPSGRS